MLGFLQEQFLKRSDPSTVLGGLRAEKRCRLALRGEYTQMAPLPKHLVHSAGYLLSIGCMPGTV